MARQRNADSDGTSLSAVAGAFFGLIGDTRIRSAYNRLENVEVGIRRNDPSNLESRCRQQFPVLGGCALPAADPQHDNVEELGDAAHAVDATREDDVLGLIDAAMTRDNIGGPADIVTFNVGINRKIDFRQTEASTFEELWR